MTIRPELSEMGVKLNIRNKFIDNHPIVKKWLRGKPTNTIKNYALKLKAFCEFSNITPEQFVKMSNNEAVDIAWDYIVTIKDEHPSVAAIVLCSVKSLYRSVNREQLNFDGNGEHYFNQKRRKRAATEHVPTNEEVYLIAEHCTTLRDKTIVHVAFQSGIRINALCKLTYGMVLRQLKDGKVPLRLRITPDIDTKPRRSKVDFYNTFLNTEAVEMLQKHCEAVHQNSKDNALLFVSRTGKKLYPTNVWSNFKKATKRAGLDSENITLHSLRKAFKRQVRNSRINHDHGEMLMGHVLQGSRENYAVRNEMIEELKQAYSEVDLTRYGKRNRNYGELSVKIDTMRQERKLLEDIINRQASETEELKEKFITAGQITDQLWETIDAMRKEIEELKKHH